LSFCPVDYFGSAPFSSLLHQIGAALHADIDIFYTGPQICSPTVTVEDVQAFAGVVHRSPLLWDNYPVNDLSMTPELHLGPIQGRASDIRSAVRGIYVNPMIQPEASKIPLATYAEFMVSDVYDPDTHGIQRSDRLPVQNTPKRCASSVSTPFLLIYPHIITTWIAWCRAL
jgi:hyaluronoglucosaminidase